MRMATENPRWGYSRIQGALKNLSHPVARSTIATILKEQGIPPSRERPTSWQAFVRAHPDARDVPSQLAILDRRRHIQRKFSTNIMSLTL